MAPTSPTPQTVTPSASVSYLQCGTDIKVPNPGSPAYGGPGPHLVVAGEGDGAYRSGLVPSSFTTGSLPIAWGAREDGTDRPDRAQLIVCLTGLRRRGTTSIGTCEWTIARGDVYPVTYTFEVYELKTAHKLADFDVESDLPAEQSCPAHVTAHIGQHGPDVAQDFDDDTLVPHLTPLVTPDLP
ncbi:hypothetical protein [Amycolatopsis sp. FDAARGOS 1241]|uniref:hypothetical protein n=1 Tax=Amycolatopsis sp. FDAARGOS 1241 TaxID=2778070 RepID=UPI00194DC9F3|nr:hypothetical protein [Amycolatopsis sp. FDAARGOS 1241]QRP47886.1 hypothetical protein I6J71_08225 [Amycolatopsis sp. FDAARGOS 1241]